MYGLLNKPLQGFKDSVSFNFSNFFLKQIRLRENFSLFSKAKENNELNSLKRQVLWFWEKFVPCYAYWGP